MPRLKSVDQIALDEEVIENDAILTALESWLNAKEESKAASAVTRKEREKVDKLLEEVPIDVGMAVRVGRFRISREVVQGRSVSFDTSDSERIRIALIEG